MPCTRNLRRREGKIRQFWTQGPVNAEEHYVVARPTGQIQMHILIENLFQGFRRTRGLQNLQVSATPQEFVGQSLLFAYLDEFVKIIGAAMYLEVPTGKGRAALVISHKRQTYIVETKVWRSEQGYQMGKRQLAAYLKLEGKTEGYSVVSDYRQNPYPQVETDTVNGCTIRSYVILVLQE